MLSVCLNPVLVPLMVSAPADREIPGSLAASRVVDNKVVRTRPLCPYPQVAKYKGAGSIGEAANFRCATP